MIKRKVSPEEKIAAVESCLNGDQQLHTIVEQYGIAKESFRTWVRNYQIFGREGLRDKHRQASYAAETQTAAVKAYLSGAGSQADTTYEERVEIVSYCIERGNDYTAAIEKYGVSYQQIYSWVRKYNEKGAEGLADKRGKRKPESEMTEVEKLRAENLVLEARNKRLELECAVLKNSRKPKGGGAERSTARASLSLRSGNAQRGICRNRDLRYSCVKPIQLLQLDTPCQA